MDRSSFSAAQPERISINQIRLSLTTGCFGGMTALAMLKLNKCGLTTVPAALTALAGSLTSLELRHNDDLQLADDDVTVLLALGKLQKLNLQKLCHEVPTEAANLVAGALIAQDGSGLVLWTQRSVQLLEELSATFLMQHGRALALQVL